MIEPPSEKVVRESYAAALDALVDTPPGPLMDHAVGSSDISSPRIPAPEVVKMDFDSLGRLEEFVIRWTPVYGQSELVRLKRRDDGAFDLRRFSRKNDDFVEVCQSCLVCPSCGQRGFEQTLRGRVIGSGLANEARCGCGHRWAVE
jgi:hypothetical protein